MAYGVAEGKVFAKGEDGDGRSGDGDYVSGSEEDYGDDERD